MRILMIAINDPAGTAIQFTNAINRYSEHTCRLITKEIRYNFMFEKDLHLPWLGNNQWNEIEELLRVSDIFHFHMTADEYIDLGPFKPIDFIQGKRVVHHHHGHPDFRQHPDTYRRKYQQRHRKHLLVSTPDLLKLLPEARWQPNLVPINASLYLPVELNGDRPLRICQAPTRTDLKDTDLFLQTVREVAETISHLQPVCIQNTEHRRCLGIKQGCQIHFDHMQGYYGVSSLESLSQGKPVIAGLDEWNQATIREFTGCDHLPWILATNACELKHHIEELAADAGLREYYGIRSRQFMQRFWNEARVLKHLIDIYMR